MRHVLALCLLPLPALADEAGHWVAVQEAVFGQIVVLPAPTSFGPGWQNAGDAHHILELVPKGETVEAWTQMLTITGDKGLALQANPEAYAKSFVGLYRDACPETFFAARINIPFLRGAEAQTALFSACGTNEGHAETAAVIVLQAGGNIYTLQWAERGPAVDRPPVPDWATWEPRLSLLLSARLCPEVAGETAPYASCAP